MEKHKKCLLVEGCITRCAVTHWCQVGRQKVIKLPTALFYIVSKLNLSHSHTEQEQLEDEMCSGFKVESQTYFIHFCELVSDHVFVCVFVSVYVKRLVLLIFPIFVR